MTANVPPQSEAAKLPDEAIADQRTRMILYASLGHALTQWQHVETAMYFIAHCLMGTEHRISSTVFFQIRSAEAKLALLDRLVIAKLPTKMWAKGGKWKMITTEVRGAIDFRNCLAHFELTEIPDGSLATPPTKYKVVLSPHHLDAHTSRSGEVDALTIETIEHNSKSLRKTGFLLMYFLIDHVPDLERGLSLLPPAHKQLLDSLRQRPRPKGL